MFLSGIPFDPPLAGISAKTFKLSIMRRFNNDINFVYISCDIVYTITCK